MRRLFLSLCVVLLIGCINAYGQIQASWQFINITNINGGSVNCVEAGNEYHVKVIANSKACACLVSISNGTPINGPCIDLQSQSNGTSSGILRVVASGNGELFVAVRFGCNGSGSATSNGSTMHISKPYCSSGGGGEHGGIQ